MSSGRKSTSVLVSWPAAATAPTMEELKFRFLPHGTISSINSEGPNAATVRFKVGVNTSTVDQMNGQFFNGYPVSAKLTGYMDNKKMLQSLTDCRAFMEGKPCRSDCMYRHHNPSVHVVCDSWLQKACTNVNCRMLHPNHAKGFQVAGISKKPGQQPGDFSCGGRCGTKNCGAKFCDSEGLLSHLGEGETKRKAHIRGARPNNRNVIGQIPPLMASMIPATQQPVHAYPPHSMSFAGAGPPTVAPPHFMNAPMMSTLPHHPAAANNQQSSNSDLEPIGIFWDIENCQVPSGKAAGAVVGRIREIYLPGRREVEFMCVCDTTKEKPGLINALNDAQVTVVHVNSTSKNAADDKIRQALRRFGKEFTPPTTIVLISSDINFTPDLSDLRYRHRFRVVLLHNSQTSGSLIACANEARRFDLLVQDVEVLNPNPKSTKPAFLLVTNLSQLSTEKSAKMILERLSNNCGGKMVAFAQMPNCNEGLLKFTSKQAAEKCQVRLRNETIDNLPISVTLVEDVENLPQDFTMASSGRQEDRVAESVSAEQLSGERPRRQNANVAQSMVSLNSSKKTRTRRTKKDQATAEDSANEASSTTNSTSNLVTLVLNNLNNTVQPKKLVWVLRKEIGSLYEVKCVNLATKTKHSNTITLNTTDLPAQCVKKLSGKIILGCRLFVSSSEKQNHAAETSPVDNTAMLSRQRSLSSDSSASGGMVPVVRVDVKEAVLKLLTAAPLRHLNLNLLQGKLKKEENHSLTPLEMENLKKDIYIGGKPGRVVVCSRAIELSDVQVDSNSPAVKDALVSALKEHGSLIPVVSVPAVYWSYNKSKIAAQSGLPVLSLVQGDCFELQLDNHQRFMVGLNGNREPSIDKMKLLIESSNDLAVPVGSVNRISKEMFGHELTLQEMIQLQNQHASIVKITNSSDGKQIVTFTDGYKRTLLESNLNLLFVAEKSIPIGNIYNAYYMHFGRVLSPAAFDFSSVHALANGLPEILQVSKGKGPKMVSLRDHSSSTALSATVDVEATSPLNVLASEIADFLNQQPSSTVMYGSFQSEFRKHHGKQLKLQDYGFSTLPELLDALELDLKVTGQGPHKFLTLMKSNEPVMGAQLSATNAATNLLSQMFAAPNASASLTLQAHAAPHAGAASLAFQAHAAPNASASRLPPPMYAAAWEHVIAHLNRISGALPIVAEADPGFMFGYCPYFGNGAENMYTALCTMIKDTLPYGVQLLGSPKEGYCLVLQPCIGVIKERCADLLSQHLYQQPGFASPYAACKAIPQLSVLLKKASLSLVQLVEYSVYHFALKTSIICNKFEMVGNEIKLCQSYAIKLLIDEVLEVLFDVENCKLPIVQVVPHYHKKFGKQLKLSIYGAEKLRELLSTETDVRLEVGDVIRPGCLAEFENNFIQSLQTSLGGALPMMRYNQATFTQIAQSRYHAKSMAEAVTSCTRKTCVVGRGSTAVLVLKDSIIAGNNCPTPVHVGYTPGACSSEEPKAEPRPVVANNHAVATEEPATVVASDMPLPSFPKLAVNFFKKVLQNADS